MKPHQERVIREREELAEKTEKLRAFIRGQVFPTLRVKEQAWLNAQHGFMSLYLAILDERIADFKEHPFAGPAGRLEPVPRAV
jgi:hypothetical protein